MQTAKINQIVVGKKISYIVHDYTDVRIHLTDGTVLVIESTDYKSPKNDFVNVNLRYIGKEEEEDG